MNATKEAAPLYDALGNGIAVGSTLCGTGLDNAGRCVTVLAIGKNGTRIKVERHIGGRVFWSSPRHYRVIN